MPKSSYKNSGTPMGQLAFPDDNVTMVDGRILINGLYPGSSELPTVPGANASITAPSDTVATDSKATNLLALQ